MIDIEKIQRSVAGLYTLTLENQLDAQGNKQRHVSVRLVKDQHPSKLSWLDDLAVFTELLLKLLEESNGIAGVLYYCPITTSKNKYKVLFEAAKSTDFVLRIQKILAQSALIHAASKPLVAIIHEPLDSIQLAPMLWAGRHIITKNAWIQLADCRLGIFPGLGVTVHAARLTAPAQAAALLLKGSSMTASDANAYGLISEVAKDAQEATLKAHKWISQGKNAGSQKEADSFADVNKDALEQQITAVSKKVNQLFPGIPPCIDLLYKSNELSLTEALALEAHHYATVLRDLKALSMMRTGYYGVIEAKSKSGRLMESELVLEKISVLGAGMMGAGIAYEAARAGLQVCLKDTEMSLAEKGKQYSEKCCDKLIQLGKSTEEEKTALLARIQPTDKAEDLTVSDVIIEAVYEQQDLKEKVITESSPYLKSSGFIASNTTSLPITGLATYTGQAENFIGMHFFSPVDRMPLVEIIRGRATSETTLDRAVQLALKLQKIPIVVRDSPAFFTSRIFFNYLLEAVTMVLEMVPAADIEREAIHAGFAVSPLAVLDEISIPLMMHVYDQLPGLTPSQKRCYQYLNGLVAAGRTGRKSTKGFYNYDLDTKTKTIWQDPSIAPTLTKSATPVEQETIQKRLLHVMALDSYRLLEEGVLQQPIDGDIGATMGVGFPVHTGGVFAHIDEVGIQQFVRDCMSFQRYGEQWNLPASMHKRANRGLSFYNGFTANWPVAL